MRADLVLMGLLGVMGFPAAAGFALVRWPFPDAGGTVRLRLDADRVCADLGGLCGANRFSLGITWVVASLVSSRARVLTQLAVIWLAELAYVVKVHGCRRAWKHGLPFLARVPASLRRNSDAYGAGKVERYRPGVPDLAEEEEEAGLVPVPFKSEAYVGQGDAPPVYTEGVGMSPVTTRASAPEPVEMAVIEETLPPFPAATSSRDERWAAHKAAVLATPLPLADEKRL